MDLRTRTRDIPLACAEHALGARLRAEHLVVKRRSAGAPTSRGTWARITVCATEYAATRGGVETTAALPPAVRHPHWHQGSSWRHDGHLWRLDETELVADAPLLAGGILTHGRDLPEPWWPQLQTALTALQAVSTSRIVTRQDAALRREHVAAAIRQVCPAVDPAVEEWAPAHGDLHWVNLTGPRLRILDWETWGLAPRGWDAATLWAASLAVPPLATRVWQTWAGDLDTPTGRTAALYQCAEVLTAGRGYAGPLYEPAQAAASQLAAGRGGR